MACHSEASWDYILEKQNRVVVTGQKSTCRVCIWSNVVLKRMLIKLLKSRNIHDTSQLAMVAQVTSASLWGMVLKILKSKADQRRLLGPLYHTNCACIIGVSIYKSSGQESCQRPTFSEVLVSFFEEADLVYLDPCPSSSQCQHIGISGDMILGLSHVGPSPRPQEISFGDQCR